MVDGGGVCMSPWHWGTLGGSLTWALLQRLKRMNCHLSLRVKLGRLQSSCCPLWAPCLLTARGIWPLLSWGGGTYWYRGGHVEDPD